MPQRKMSWIEAVALRDRLLAVQDPTQRAAEVRLAAHVLRVNVETIRRLLRGETYLSPEPHPACGDSALPGLPARDARDARDASVGLPDLGRILARAHTSAPADAAAEALARFQRDTAIAKGGDAVVEELRQSGEPNPQGEGLIPGE